MRHLKWYRTSIKICYRAKGLELSMYLNQFILLTFNLLDNEVVAFCLYNRYSCNKIDCTVTYSPGFFSFFFLHTSDSDPGALTSTSGLQEGHLFWYSCLLQTDCNQLGRQQRHTYVCPKTKSYLDFFQIQVTWNGNWEFIVAVSVKSKAATN